jgi:hypothetical protein
VQHQKSKISNETEKMAASAAVHAAYPHLDMFATGKLRGTYLFFVHVRNRLYALTEKQFHASTDKVETKSAGGLAQLVLWKEEADAARTCCAHLAYDLALYQHELICCYQKDADLVLKNPEHGLIFTALALANPNIVSSRLCAYLVACRDGDMISKEKFAGEYDKIDMKTRQAFPRYFALFSCPVQALGAKLGSLSIC